MEYESGNEKISLLFVVNVKNYKKFHQYYTATSVQQKEITKFKLTYKRSTISVKFLENKKKYEYFTCRLKSEKDISSIIRNLPLSITESEIYEKLKNLNYSVTRLISKSELPLPSIAIQ